MLAQSDTRAVRHEATRARILEAAWDLAREEGLGALSLREIARRVGMRAPSLYTYFDSKNALYDAMYAQAVLSFRAAVEGRPAAATPEENIRNRIRAFVAHFANDPVGFQIVMQRPIPGFEPSPESFALTVTGLGGVRADLEAAGIRSERALDFFRVLTTGIVSVQIANEPGGDRWLRLADDASDVFLARYGAKKKPEKGKGR